MDLKKKLNSMKPSEDVQDDIIESSDTSEAATQDIKERLAEAHATLTGMASSGETFVNVPMQQEDSAEPILLGKPEKGVTFYSTNRNQPFATALPNGVMVKGPYTTEDKDEIKFLQQFVDNDNMPSTVSTEKTYIGMDEDKV